jgi:hypothetical protein
MSGGGSSLAILIDNGRLISGRNLISMAMETIKNYFEIQLFEHEQVVKEPLLSRPATL